MLSCIVVYNNTDYQLYTKASDGAWTYETLDLAATGNMIDTDSDPLADDLTQTSDEENKADQTGSTTESSHALPTFSYTGDDVILQTICSYMMTCNDFSSYYSSETSVYIPAPVIFDTIPEGNDLMVFCNLWSFNYYQNGNTLECESGGEAPARLRLHPNADAPGGYEVIEYLKTGDGSEYAKGIQEFCKGYPGMERKYYEGDGSTPKEISTTLIRMYVQDNDLDIKYYKDYGWDPIPVD